MTTDDVRAAAERCVNHDLDVYDRARAGNVLAQYYLATPADAGLDLERLASIAEKATPGPWISAPLEIARPRQRLVAQCCGQDVLTRDNFVYPTNASGESHDPYEDPQYIAAFDPPTVKSLLALARRGRDAERELTVLRKERDEARLRLLSAAGDDLCRLTPEEIKELSSGAVKIPPKGEFLASCERFHEQIAAGPGVLSNCLTLAQLIAENEKLRDKRDQLRGRLEDALQSLIAVTCYCDNGYCSICHGSWPNEHRESCQGAKAKTALVPAPEVTGR